MKFIKRICSSIVFVVLALIFMKMAFWIAEGFCPLHTGDYIAIGIPAIVFAALADVVFCIWVQGVFRKLDDFFK